jgi:hypothetical protein
MERGGAALDDDDVNTMYENEQLAWALQQSMM